MLCSNAFKNDCKGTKIFMNIHLFNRKITMVTKKSLIFAKEK